MTESKLPVTESSRSLLLAMAAARTAAENRGRDIVLLDMRKQTQILDYFLIVTGTSRRQLRSLSEEIHHTLKVELKDKRIGLEGYDEGRWIVLDYGDLVVHLFDDDTRKFYSLERLWADAVPVPLPFATEPSEPTEPAEPVDSLGWTDLPRSSEATEATDDGLSP